MGRADGGCDKTTPALLLGAISMGIPAIYMPAGPMLRATGKASPGLGLPMPGILDEAPRWQISDDDWVDVEAASRAPTVPA